MTKTTSIYICDVCKKEFKEGFSFDGGVFPIKNGKWTDHPIIDLTDGEPPDICIECVEKLFYT